MNTHTEFAEKLARVRGYLKAHGFDGVLYCGNDNFSWLTCGHYGFVDKSTGEAAAKLLVTGDRQYVICNSSEMYRIPQEELGDSEFELVRFPWHADEASVLQKLIAGGTIASDSGGFDTQERREELARLRYVLTDGEITRYREIGPLAAGIVEDCCRDIRLGDSELAIAGAVTGRLMSAGFQVPVCLVAADDRLLHYRHPIPTQNTVRERAQVAVCTQKYGLTISITRIVSFREPDSETRRKYDAVTAIDAAYILNTVPGARAGEIVKQAHDVYTQWGYEADFHLHHQGGALGYRTRDYCANEQNQELVRDRQAFSWNPTIRGVKCEDTFLVCNGRQELLSQTDRWPVREVTHNGKGIRRPEILLRL